MNPKNIGVSRTKVRFKTNESMKEVKCTDCGEGTGIMRHDKHLLHKFGLVCYTCQENNR